MRKRTLLTLALAGAITVCGVGGLYVCMAKTMQEETTIQVPQKEEAIFEVSVTEENMQKEDVDQVWQEAESIYLPEGAQIVSKGEGCYGIVWDDYTIEYWQGGKYCEQETKEDLGLAKLVPILKDTIKKYSNQDMKKCEMEVHLVGTEEIDYEVKEGDKCVPVEGLETEDGSLYTDERLYAFASKHYQVSFQFDKNAYFIMVDSVTGEVFAYYYNNQNLGDYSHGWEKIQTYAPVEYELAEEEQKEYDAMIAAFVTNDLKLGNVEKVFGQDWGLAYLENGSENDARAYYSAICKTSDGTMVEVSVDMGEKMVNSFDTTVIYSSEG